MHILLIAQEPPIDPQGVVTGNAVRTAQLSQALTVEGHTVHQVWLSKSELKQTDSYRNRDELHSLILTHKPDVLLVSFWHLMELLPTDNPIPVVLDFVAPRPLEELFQYPESVSWQLRQLRLNLAKADLLLVGNTQQASLLYLSLIEAGHDLREHIPVIALPLAAELAAAPASDPVQSGWTLVSGGVDRSASGTTT